MKQLSATRVYTLADDIQIELTKLERLATDIIPFTAINLHFAVWLK